MNYFWLFLIDFAYRIVCMEVGITAVLGIITIREGFLAVYASSVSAIKQHGAFAGILNCRGIIVSPKL